MVPGVLETLLDGVHRVIAPNPGLMTGPGTNTYLLGHKNITVIDPGPPMAGHIDAIAAALDQLDARLERILVTHTHPDHSPGAALLAERFRVPVIGASIENDGHQDLSFSPTEGLAHGDCFDADGSGIEAIYTPGHVGNHFCFFHHPSGCVFTGDHIMQGSTVVIIPPAGDMADYIASLRLLLDYPLRYMAPGHGGLIDQPVAEVEGLVAHRQGREEKVFAALQELGSVDLNVLVVTAYDDVDASIHPIAQLSLRAHLLKLEKEGRVSQCDDVWSVR